MRAAGFVLAKPGLLGAAQRALGLVARALRHRSTIGALPIQGWAANWTGARDIPVPPRQSFRRWWRRSHKTQPPTPHTAQQTRSETP
jgi:L-lactate dehydrogenase complex protein LldF